MSSAEPTTEEQFVTLEEAARLFRVTTRSIRRWCDEGRFHPARIGRKQLIPSFEVAAALNEGSHGPWTYELREDGEIVAIATASREGVKWAMSANCE